MINSKKKKKKTRATDRNCPIGQKYFIDTSQPRARIRNVHVHYHMPHVVKIDILTGHEEIGNLHFILKIIFIACLWKNLHFLKTWTVYYEIMAYCLPKIVKIFISETTK